MDSQLVVKMESLKRKVSESENYYALNNFKLYG